MLAPYRHDRSSRRLSGAYNTELADEQLVCRLHPFAFGREHAR